jgi:hypothetical protein
MSKRLKISDHFYLDEYITPDMYIKWGDKAIWWIRPELVRIDEFLRTRFNIPMVINDWWVGGDRTQSGLRYPQATIGAGDSMHKFGVASDTQFVGKPNSFYDEVRQDIIDNFDVYKELGLTTIEANTPTWLHKDCRNIPNQTKINIVPIPKK